MYQKYNISWAIAGSQWCKWSHQTPNNNMIMWKSAVPLTTSSTLRRLSSSAGRRFLFVESILLKPRPPAFFAGKLPTPPNRIFSEPSFKNTKLEAIRWKINKFDYRELRRSYKNLSIHLPIYLPTIYFMWHRHEQAPIFKTIIILGLNIWLRNLANQDAENNVRPAFRTRTVWGERWWCKQANR